MSYFQMDYLCYINTPSQISVFIVLMFYLLLIKSTLLLLQFLFTFPYNYLCQIRLKLARIRGSIYVKLTGGRIKKWTTDGGFKVINKFN